MKNQFEVASKGNNYKFYINFLTGSEGSFPYFIASGHSSPSNGVPRSATGLTTPGWNSYPDFPHTDCWGTLCTISFEGTNILSQRKLDNDYKGKRVGIIMSDFPGKTLIESVIQANIDKSTNKAINLAVRANNLPPVAKLAIALDANESSSITFDATGSVDQSGDKLNFEWELVDADPAICSRSASDGASIRAYNDILQKFADDNPTLLDDSTGKALAIAFADSDEGKAAATALKNSPDELGKATFACSDDLTASVKVTVSDLYGGKDEATVKFTFLNVAPTVTVTGGTIDENGIADISVTVADPGVLDTFTVLINWADGSEDETVDLDSSLAGTQTFTRKHQYIDDDPTNSATNDYTVQVTATDKDAGSGSDSAIVTVRNVAPSASINAITDEVGNIIDVDLVSVLVNLDVSLVTSFSDIGTKDTHALDIDWDDGTVNSFTYLDQSLLTRTTDSHFYPAPGSYTVTVTVVDDDQGMFYVNRLLIVVNSVGAIQEAIASWGSLVVLNQSLLTATKKSWYAKKATEKMEKAIEIIDGDSDARDYYKCLKYVARAIKFLEKTEMSDSRPRIIIVSQLMLAAKSVAVQFLTEAHIMKETADEKDLEKMDKAERYFAEGNAHADVGNAHANAGKAVKSYSRSLRALPKVHKTKPSSKRTKSRRRGRKSNL